MSTRGHGPGKPLRIYEMHLASWRHGVYSYRELAQPGCRSRQRPRLHPCRAAAGRRASVRRLVGLPGHRLLRADRAVRRARRLPGVRRRAAPTRHRRDPRLGARALPARRVEPGAVRRHQAVRALRPAPGRASRLGHAGVQLRPPRGAELPHRQRAVLVGGVPHRRSARRRGGQHAVPRLLAFAGWRGCRTSTAAARTWMRSPSFAS